jgi:hypothetical protein
MVLFWVPPRLRHHAGEDQADADEADAVLGRSPRMAQPSSRASTGTR